MSRVGSSEQAQPAPEDRPLEGAEDDFFCLRYGVWYPSLDCAYRTKFQTAPGCLDCDQGRFNLKRHSARLQRDPLAVLVRRGCS